MVFGFVHGSRTIRVHFTLRFSLWIMRGQKSPAARERRGRRVEAQLLRWHARLRLESNQRVRQQVRQRGFTRGPWPAKVVPRHRAPGPRPSKVVWFSPRHEEVLVYRSSALTARTSAAAAAAASCRPRRWKSCSARSTRSARSATRSRSRCIPPRVGCAHYAPAQLCCHPPAIRLPLPMTQTMRARAPCACEPHDASRCVSMSLCRRP